MKTRGEGKSIYSCLTIKPVTGHLLFEGRVVLVHSYFPQHNFRLACLYQCLSSVTPPFPPPPPLRVNCYWFVPSVLFSFAESKM